MPSAREAAEWAWGVLKEQENTATYLDVSMPNSTDETFKSFNMNKQEGI